MRGLTKISFVLLLAAVSLLAWETAGGYAERMEVEVIALKHRRAEEVIPVLQPFVRGEGTISGMGNQLIIQTTPANLADIKKILGSIDGAPRRLMITVRQASLRDIERDEMEISGRATGGDTTGVAVGGSGKDRGLTVGAKKGDDSVLTRVFGISSPEIDSTTQQVQVLEGNKAFINVGLVVPMPGATFVRNSEGVHAIDTIEYRDVGTGFYVLPRVADDIVTLEISPHHDTLGRRVPGTVNVQRMTTTVSGPLGKWIEIGALDQHRSGERSRILGLSRGTSNDQRRILLKVDEIK